MTFAVVGCGSLRLDGRLDGRVRGAERNSATAALQQVESFIDMGLDGIFQVRNQEAPLAAWYQEAFYRGRGIAE